VICFFEKNKKKDRVVKAGIATPGILLNFNMENAPNESVILMLAHKR
jgi:hypothetical protein